MTDPTPEEWEPLLREVRERVTCAAEHGDRDPVLDSSSLDLAELLWTTARDGDQAVPLEVAVAVAELYWWRDDLEAAAGIYAMIDEAAPDAVPDAVRPLLRAAAAAVAVEDDVTTAVDALVAAESGDDPAALDEAVSCFRRLHERFDPADAAEVGARHIVLTDYGLALRLRGERDGAPGDLDDAVALTLAALDLPDHDDERGALLGNAAIAHGTRFAATGDPADLNRGVALGEQALEATPGDDDGWAGRATNLSGLHQIRFDRTREPSDLDRAVLSTWAAERTPDDLPAAGLRWSNVSNALAPATT